MEYHVSTILGEDTNPGTKASPWRTLERVNAGRYLPGDSVVLRGGKTFPGTLSLSQENATTTSGSMLNIHSLRVG